MNKKIKAKTIKTLSEVNTCESIEGVCGWCKKKITLDSVCDDDSFYPIPYEEMEKDMLKILHKSGWKTIYDGDDICETVCSDCVSKMREQTNETDSKKEK